MVTVGRAGHERKREYVSREELAPGDVVVLDEHHWLVDSVDPPRAVAKLARYRLRLRHPDEREDLGAFRRYRPGGPRLGHGFTTLEDGHPVSWEIVEERLARDDDGEPYLDLVAERDHGELEGDLPNHELEHALARREWEFPEAAAATLARAEREGLSLELVLLEAGEEPDWGRPGASSTRWSWRRSRTTCSTSAASGRTTPATPGSTR